MIVLNFRLLCLLFVTLVLTLLPLPHEISHFCPPWVLLFVLYVQFFLPHYFHAILLIALGLCLDVMLSTVLGEHVFALVLTTWFAASKARRFQFFTLLQQMILIALLGLLYQVIIFVIDIYLGYKGGLWILAGSVLMSAFLWPWVRTVADKTVLLSK